MRRYPDELTPAQRRMLHTVEHNPHYQPGSPKTHKRFETLVERGFIVATSDGAVRVKRDLLPQVTCFIREGDDGPIKICVSHATNIVEKLQQGNARTLHLLGAFPSDRMRDLNPSIARHHLGNGWYNAHRDVLKWLAHKDFETEVI